MTLTLQKQITIDEKKITLYKNESTKKFIIFIEYQGNINFIDVECIPELIQSTAFLLGES